MRAGWDPLKSFRLFPCPTLLLIDMGLPALGVFQRQRGQILPPLQHFDLTGGEASPNFHTDLSCCYLSLFKAKLLPSHVYEPAEPLHCLLSYSALDSLQAVRTKYSLQSWPQVSPQLYVCQERRGDQLLSYRLCSYLPGWCLLPPQQCTPVELVTHCSHHILL